MSQEIEKIKKKWDEAEEEYRKYRDSISAVTEMKKLEELDKLREKADDYRKKYRQAIRESFGLET